MPIPSDYANDLVRNQKTIPNDILAQLILFTQKAIKVPEDDTVTNNIFYSPLIDKHDTTILLSDITTLEENRINNHIATPLYTKKIDLPVHCDPLIYDFTNASGLSFHQPGQNIGTRFGGAAVTDGNSYITIADDPSLNVTDELTFAMWVYLIKDTVTTATILERGLLGGYFFFHDSINPKITMLLSIGGISSLAFTIPNDGWFHIVITYKSGTQNMYVNNTLVSTTTNVGSISTPSNGIGIFANESGANMLTADHAISWLSIIHGFVDSTWVNNDFNGLRDLTGMDELVCFPFIGNTNPEPPATCGICGT